MKQSNGSHGDSVGVGSDSGSLPVLLELYTQSSYLRNNQESVRYTFVALCAIGNSVALPLPPSLLSLRMPYYMRVLVITLYIGRPKYIDKETQQRETDYGT